MATPATGRPEKPVSGDHPDIAAVAQALRNLRHGAGLTLRELALRANYSVATLSSATSGSTLPRWEVADAYARGCSATPEEAAELRSLWQKADDGHGTHRSQLPAPKQKPVAAPEETAGTASSIMRLTGRIGRTAAAKKAVNAGAGGPSEAAPPSASAAQSTAQRPQKSDGHESRPTFADAVVSDAPPQVRRPPLPTPGPRRQWTMPADPGNSVPALMRQARAIAPAHPATEPGPFDTALDLCTTPAQFAELLQLLWSRSGLSLHEVHQRAKKGRLRVTKSSLKAALHGTELPRTEVLQAVLHACQCPSEQWRMWHHTRIRLKLALLVADEERPVSRIRNLRVDPVLRAAVVYPAVFVLAVGQLITLYVLLH